MIAGVEPMIAPSGCARTKLINVVVAEPVMPRCGERRGVRRRERHHRTAAGAVRDVGVDVAGVRIRGHAGHAGQRRAAVEIGPQRVPSLTNFQPVGFVGSATGL